MDRLTITKPYEDECHYIRCDFMLLGKGQEIYASKPSEILIPGIAGKYFFRGNGLRPPYIANWSSTPYSFLSIAIHSSILHSFTASPGGKLPLNLQHLVRPPSQEIYLRSGDTTSVMDAILQQILNCPHQGLIKRAYLESKAIELMALVLEQEVAIQQGETKKVSLKPEQIERIHYAKEILLQDLGNPPSLEELARQAGLNEFILKKGFRNCFGTTVFGELRLYVYGFVEPKSGKTLWYLIPRVNTTWMNVVLETFATEAGAGQDKIILLVQDRAGWHRSKKANLPSAIKTEFLPAYSLELQPAERLWSLIDKRSPKRI